MVELGAIFDFDGVCFHSEREHEACWHEIAREEGFSMSREKFLRGFGVKNELFIKEIVQWTENPKEIAQIIARKEALFQKRLLTHPLKPIVGTIDLVRRLVHAHIPCAIGSSSVMKNIDLVLDSFPDIRALFSVIISGDDVHIGKPNPEVFLKAAEKLHIPPSRCVVFEDAPLGIEAAKRGGMKAIGLATTFTEDQLQAACPDRTVDSLSSFSLADLFSLFE